MYEYSDIQTAVIVVFGAIAAFVLVTNAIKAWKELSKPSADLRETVEEHGRTIEEDHGKVEDHESRISHLEGCCTEVQGKLENDWKFQQATSEVNELMLLSIKQLLKHSIDGNDTDGLAEVEDQIDRYLIKHQR